MSRMPLETAVKKRGRKPKPPRREYADYTEEERAARLAYSEIPNLTGSKIAAEWVAEKLNVEISHATIERDTENGRLTMNLVAGRRHYSPRSLYDYIVLNSNTSAPRQKASA